MASILRDDEYSDLPESLRRELRALYVPQASWPAGRDQRILSAARFASGMRRHRIWRIAGSIGIAAAVALAAGAIWRSLDRPAVYARTGDIRDAFYLARAIYGHQALEAKWDVNGDGNVDEKDVRALAMVAVRVDEGREASP